MTARRLTRAELEHIIGVESLYLCDLQMMEDEDTKEEQEWVEYLILKMEVMRDETRELRKNLICPVLPSARLTSDLSPAGKRENA